jgi:hypothetical protein
MKKIMMVKREKVLLKKGDRKRNVEDYLNKILVSLEDRQESGDVDADIDDYSFEVEEPSIIPKKVYRKELFELQVEKL